MSNVKRRQRSKYEGGFDDKLQKKVVMMAAAVAAAADMEKKMDGVDDRQQKVVVVQEAAAGVEEEKKTKMEGGVDDEQQQKHTWARGGDGWDATHLASKNLSPPQEPKIRKLEKNSKKGKSAIFFWKILLFRDFCMKRLDPYLLKMLLASYFCFRKNPSFLL